MPFKSWIKAFRLRTLPLALASVLMGSFVAINTQSYRLNVIVLAIITTLLLQILSNLANDYGDGIKGTDNDDRLGPKRTVQSGEITPRQMKNGIIVFSLLSFISGAWLIFESTYFSITSVVFLILGIGAIAASIKYTVGRKAYGYSGFGDLFVFIFFGPVAVIGTSYLASQTFNYTIILPAFAIGFLSTGVLNLNNMRDITNDKKSGKHTIALNLGIAKAKIYHYLLICSSLTLLLIYSALNYISIWQFMYVIMFPLFIYDLVQIKRTNENKLLDPFLKSLALSILTLTILFGIGLLIASGNTF